MDQHQIVPIESAIGFIEDHLYGRLELDTVARAVHYSKYHLHRMFTQTVGTTPHDYVVRRRLTAAAELLTCSERPVLEIALQCGYESQQAFTSAFRAMYKAPPAEYRKRRAFYPLRLRFSPRRTALTGTVSKSIVRFAGEADIPAWMELVRAVVDGYPGLDEAEYLQALRAAVQEQRALLVRDGRMLAGGMAFSYETARIDFLGVHPQYRDRGLQSAFLDRLLEDLLPDRELSITTYRAGDRADAGLRRGLEALGFTGRELLVEYGYPTQRFTHPPKSGGEGVGP